MTSTPEQQQPSVVAVIALYNGAQFIERALDSIRLQTRAPDEVVVVDDGSTDAGAALVAQIAEDWPALTLVHKPNGGQSSARNFGVAQSRSNLIAFLDQDDFWYADHLASLLAPFASAVPPTGWSYGDVDVGDRDGTLTVPAFLHTRPAQHPKTSLRACMADDMFILPSAALVRRSTFVAVGGFDERLSGYEDDDLFLRILAAGFTNVFVDRPLSMWRIYGGSTTFTPAMARSRLIFAAKLLARCDDFGAEAVSVRHSTVPRFIKNLLGEYVRAARRNDGALMRSSLADIRSTLLPHCAPARRWALQAMLLGLAIHPLGRFLTNERVMPTLRRMAGLPAPLHVGT